MKCWRLISTKQGLVIILGLVVFIFVLEGQVILVVTLLWGLLATGQNELWSS